MVARIVGMVLGMTLAAPSYALTADQLRDMTQRAQAAAKSRDSRLAPGDVTPVLPKPTTGTASSSEAAPTPAPAANNSKASAPRSRKAATANATPEPAGIARDTPAASATSTLYQPPVRTVSATSSASALVYAAPTTFGIPEGTWLDGELDRALTNVEGGEASIRVTRPIVGRYRTLEAGATLFGVKTFNSGSRRLEVNVRHGVDANGQSFVLNALVYEASQARVAGLAGEIHKNEDSGTRAGKISALAVAREGLREVTAGNVIASAVGAGADTLINDESQKMAAEAAQYIIQVPMQSVLLRVITAF